MKHFAIISVFLLLCSFLSVSCLGKKEENIVLDDSQPLALAPDVLWAVVVDPYAGYKKELGWNSENSGHCRKGEVLQVIGQAEDEQNTVWYCFKDGWLSSECLRVYNNRYKAQSAAEELIKK